MVQSTPIPTWPDAPLPTDYWSNPINDQNRDWWTISGNWLETNGFNSAAEGYYYKGGGYNPYTAGPTSAHILWAQPEPSAFGGVMGGVVSENGGVGNYYTGMSYEQTWGMNYGPWIISGMLYFDNPTFAAPNYGSYCYDLATGNEYGNKTSQSLLLRCSSTYHPTNSEVSHICGIRKVLHGACITQLTVTLSKALRAVQAAQL